MRRIHAACLVVAFVVGGAPLVGQRVPADDIARARTYVLEFRVDSAAHLLRFVLDPESGATPHELAQAWILIGTVEFIGGRDSAAAVAVREAVRLDSAVQLEALGEGRPELAATFAFEKLLRRYELAGRPLDPPGDSGVGPLVPPEVTDLPAPTYPDPLYRQGIEGDVIIAALIDTTGRVDRRWVVVGYSPQPGFIEPATRAVVGLRARPATRGGRRVPALVHVPVRFRTHRVAWRSEIFTATLPRSGVPHAALPPLEVSPVEELAAARRALAAGKTDTAMGLVRDLLSPDREVFATRTAQATAYVLLGAVHLVEGKPEEARGDFRVAALLDSAQRPEPLGDLHADLVSFFEAELSVVRGRRADTATLTPLDVDDPPVFTGGAPLWYPYSLQRRGVKGRVMIEAVLDTIGRVEPRSVHVVSSVDSGLNLAALEFAIKARFHPARLHGRAVRVRIRVPIDFTPSEVYSDSLVEEPPERLSGPPLEYPDSLRRQGVDGVVVLEAVLDTAGRVEPGSIRTLTSPHPGLAQAAKEVLLFTRYRPARIHGRAVRVLIRQPFSFCVGACRR